MARKRYSNEDVLNLHHMLEHFPELTPETLDAAGKTHGVSRPVL